MHSIKLIGSKPISLNWVKSVRPIRRNVFSESAEIRTEDNLKMTAWQIHSYGDLNELIFSTSVRIPPVRNVNDVEVEIQASSVNPIDLAMLGGYGSTTFNLFRQLQSCRMSNVLEFPLTLGREFSGKVLNKGNQVGKEINIGEDVWGVVPFHRQGSHSQRVIVDKSCVHKRPSNITPLEGACILYAGLTAWSALKISGDLLFQNSKGKKVLVLGASGGVGTVATQLLKAWDATVIATCRQDAVPLLQSLGADCVLDYTQPEFKTELTKEGKYDIILDAAGLGSDAANSFTHLLKEWNLSKFITLRSPLLNNIDNYGLIGGMAKNVGDVAISNIQTLIKSRSSTVRWGFFAPCSNAIKEISNLVEDRKIKAIIDTKYSYTELPAAFQQLAEGHTRGKIVINMEDEKS